MPAGAVIKGHTAGNPAAFCDVLLFTETEVTGETVTQIRTTSPTLARLLSDRQIDRTRQDGQTFYAVIDMIRALTGTAYPEDVWSELKRRDAHLALLTQTFETTEADGTVRQAEFVDVQGVLRVVQSLDSPRAERIKRWLAFTGQQRLAEARNPELAVLRARREYEAKGYDRRWIDKRVRSVSARHELTSEWARRGATDSQQYRELTNELTRGSFGLDVEGYRRYKGLTGSNRKLRDHMSDLELVLNQLAEQTAVALHKTRGSQGYDELVRDARDAGEIVAQARREIEARSGQPVVAAR
jgi:DNA-damage-inducible protein D